MNIYKRIIMGLRPIGDAVNTVGFFRLLWLFMWLLCVGAFEFTLYFQEVNYHPLFSAFMFVLCVVFAVFHFMSYFPGEDGVSRSLTFSIIVNVSLFLLLGFSFDGLLNRSIHNYEVMRNMAIRHELGDLKDFALRNYDVDIGVSDVNSGWTFNRLRAPNSSVAVMSILPGYCEVSYDREMVNLSVHTKDNEFGDAFRLGVLMHEFGHCLDVYRDHPNYHDHQINTNSIAPVDRVGVSNLQSYIERESRLSTLVWREGLADIFEVGYWRLNQISRYGQLSAKLLEHRQNNHFDKSHQTGCFIKAAIDSESPPSNKDLFEWADKVRSNANCKI